MEMSVFFAWQSDSPRDDNKHLIRDAASAALKKIAKDATLRESPRLDQDVKGLSGTPEIAASIFQKIDECSFFIGDVTYVGKNFAGTKLLPNPNVAAEMAYAAKSIGWERIILVMNTAYGPPEEQMFDIRHRSFPICYNVPDDKPELRADAEKKLAEVIEGAIRSTMKVEHSGAVAAAKALNEDCLRLMALNCLGDCFMTPRPEDYNETSEKLLNRADYQRAVDRLLDLKLIWCDMTPKAGKYAYHWTYKGHLVMWHLKFRRDDNWPPKKDE